MKDYSVKVVDFSGQNIYIGIDDHLKQWNVGIYTDRSFHRVFQQPPDAKQLRRYLDRHFPGANYYSVCEVGFKGFCSHRELEAVGIRNIMVHAADVPTKDRERKQKRDRVDAQKLGRGLRAGELDALFVPGVKAEQDRSLVRYRCENLMPKLVRIKLQIKSFLNVHARPLPAEFRTGRWTKALKKWLEAVKFDHPSADRTFKLMLQELFYYEARVKEVNRELVKLAQDPDYKKKVDLLRTIPGIGLLSALVFILELGDMRRFKKMRHLCSYVGLIPNVRGSDDKVRIGRQTKRGNALVRRMLTQCAWRARSADPALLKAYDELCGRMKPNKAIVRIQRKLLSRMRHMLLHEEGYHKGIY